MKHGTRSKYVSDHCRCVECVEANRLYIEQWRRRRGVKPLRRATHGSAWFYASRGCRCDACRAANTAARRRSVGPHVYSEDRRSAIAAGRWPQYADSTEKRATA